MRPSVPHTVCCKTFFVAVCNNSSNFLDFRETLKTSGLDLAQTYMCVVIKKREQKHTKKQTKKQTKKSNKEIKQKNQTKKQCMSRSMLHLRIVFCALPLSSFRQSDKRQKQTRRQTKKSNKKSNNKTMYTT